MVTNEESQELNFISPLTKVRPRRPLVHLCCRVGSELIEKEMFQTNVIHEFCIYAMFACLV
jgi:hypothetical protein